MVSACSTSDLDSARRKTPKTDHILRAAAAAAKGLLALKAIVENRETLASWKEGSKPCGEGSTANWFFVVCENGRVVELRMAGLLLNSTLPEEMALLTELQIL